TVGDAIPASGTRAAPLLRDALAAVTRPARSAHVNALGSPDPLPLGEPARLGRPGCPARGGVRAPGTRPSRRSLGEAARTRLRRPLAAGASRVAVCDVASGLLPADAPQSAVRQGNQGVAADDAVGT